MLHVTLEDGGLFLEPTAQSKVPLLAESETKFFLRGADIQISFIVDETGAVTDAIVHQNGRDARAPRR